MLEGKESSSGALFGFQPCEPRISYGEGNPGYSDKSKDDLENGNVERSIGIPGLPRFDPSGLFAAFIARPPLFFVFGVSLVECFLKGRSDVPRDKGKDACNYKEPSKQR